MKPDCTGADAFPNDPLQWCDKDGDGVGDNYVFTNITVPDEENTGLMIELANKLEMLSRTMPHNGLTWIATVADNNTGIAPDAFLFERHSKTTTMAMVMETTSPMVRTGQMNVETNTEHQPPTDSVVQTAITTACPT